MNTAHDFWSAKSTWLGIAYVAKSLAEPFYPRYAWLEAMLNGVFIGLGYIFIRDTIAKAGAEPAKIKPGVRRHD